MILYGRAKVAGYCFFWRHMTEHLILVRLTRGSTICKFVPREVVDSYGAVEDDSQEGMCSMYSGSVITSIKLEQPAWVLKQPHHHTI